MEKQQPLTGLVCPFVLVIFDLRGWGGGGKRKSSRCKRAQRGPAPPYLSLLETIDSSPVKGEKKKMKKA